MSNANNQLSSSTISKDLAPLEACISCDESCVLAVIIGVEGPSYRPLVALMTICASGVVIGTLSSGCVEEDIKLNALDCLKTGSLSILRYGRGSPFLDIVLPCGGGLEILLIPNPEKMVISQILKTVVSDRGTCAVDIQTVTGELSFGVEGCRRPTRTVFSTKMSPELRFLVFGKGPEATAFAALTHSTSYETTLLSPDQSTLDTAHMIGCDTIEMKTPGIAKLINADPRTAIVLFFHDHDWEPPILRDALETSAFYIGAQGSKRARDSRMCALRDLGVGAENLARLRGPIGLISSARDSRTLAISVLAEVIQSSATPVKLI